MRAPFSLRTEVDRREVEVDDATADPQYRRRVVPDLDQAALVELEAAGIVSGKHAGQPGYRMLERLVIGIDHAHDQLVFLPQLPQPLPLQGAGRYPCLDQSQDSEQQRDRRQQQEGEFDGDRQVAEVHPGSSSRRVRSNAGNRSWPALRACGARN